VTSKTETAIAEAQTTASLERLTALSTHRDKAVRAGVARNPSAPASLLSVLAADKHHLVRYGVAENPSPHAWAVAMRAADPDVRVMLAQRSDLDEATLEALICAPERKVRESLAASTKEPAVLARLARDAHPNVRATTATRPTLLVPDDLELLASDRIAQVRGVVVQSGLLQYDTVTRLGADRSANVRYFTLETHPERHDIANSLIDDEDPDIAKLARRQASRRQRKRLNGGTA
jgi:hypothetical protein